MSVHGHVFICHSSRDAELANRLVRRIEETEQKCWLAPRDVVGGESYPRQLIKAISSCDFFLLLVTKHSVESGHVLREVEQAVRRHRAILPVVVDGAMSPDLDYFLGALHQITGDVEEVVRRVAERFSAPDGNPRESASPLHGAEQHHFTVGVIPFPPFSGHPASTRPTGYYISLLDAFAEETGRSVEYVPITNDKTVTLLESGEIDVVACLYRTPRRASHFLFAASYYASAVTAVVRADEARIRTQKDLMDEAVRIAVCRGEVGSELAQDVYRAAAGSPRLIEIDTVDVKAIAAMVAAGAADVAITDTVTCDLIVESSVVPLKEIFTRRPLFVGHIGLMLAKRNATLAATLDDELSRIRGSAALRSLEDEIVDRFPDLLEVL